MNKPSFPIGKTGLTLHVIGLGDVGGTLLTGLVLLGTMFDTIGVYDPDAKRVSRYEQEMNQILPVGGHKPRVRALAYTELFERCDAAAFTASAGVPPIGGDATDVRMAQYERNRAILRPYGALAVSKSFTGLFFQVSDPVDRLCGVLAEAGVSREQIVGCGLGVMLARADYCARKHGVADFLARGRVYGPHGEGLVVANDTGDGYDDALSQALTREVVTANLSVRETGYKPYIAPGLSSGCITIINALAGNSFDGAIDCDGVFMGCRARLAPDGAIREPWPESPLLRARIQQTMEVMRAWNRG